MESEDMVILDEFCATHRLEISFIRSLEDHGLVEVIRSNQTLCISNSDLPRLEQIVRLYRELNINPEGIDAISNLLHRIEDLQAEISKLRNRLNFYEQEDNPA